MQFSGRWYDLDKEMIWGEIAILAAVLVCTSMCCVYVYEVTTHFTEWDELVLRCTVLVIRQVDLTTHFWVAHLLKYGRNSYPVYLESKFFLNCVLDPQIY